MAFTKEESAEIKKLIISQIKRSPNENNEAIIKQVEMLDDNGLEEFLKQNGIEFKSGKLKQAGGSSQGQSSVSEKPIFESIVKREIPSYNIDENEKSIAILEINPLSRGHCLVLPRIKTTTEKIPKSAITLAQKIGKRIKSKLKAEDIKIETFSFQDYPAINIIPIYKDKQLQKYQEKESELKLLQKKLEVKKRTKRIKKERNRNEEGSEKPKNSLKEVRPRVPY